MTRVFAFALLAIVATPALAVPFCPDSGPGLHLHFGIGFGRLTESERNEVNLGRLRHAGVDASMVHEWNGCLQAFVRDADGRGEHMEFYDPDTLERVR